MPKIDWKIPTDLLKAIALAILSLVLGGSARPLHEVYLMNRVGNNTLFVRSADDAEHQGSATAFEMRAASGKVFTVTNAHVCGLANEKNQIMIADKLHSDRLLPIRILEVYPDNDLCILEGLANYSGLVLGESPHVNETVYALGYPLGESLSFSEGRIKAFDEIYLRSSVPMAECDGDRFKSLEDNWYGKICLESFKSISTDLSIFPGNSGSALVDSYGNVVGVIFASNNQTHWGHAVIQEDLIRLLKAY